MNFVPLLELCYRYFVQFQMVNAIIQSFSRSLLLNDVMVEMSTRVSLTSWAVENHTSSQVHVGLTNLKSKNTTP